MQRLQPYKNELEQILKASPSKRKALLSKCSSKLIGVLCEIVHNLLKGNIKLGSLQLDRLKRYKSKLRAVHQCCNLKTKTINKRKARKLITQTGGALPFILPFLPLIGKAIATGAAAATGGAIVNKIIGKK